MSEEKAPLLQDEEIQKQFMPLPIFIVLGMGICAMYLGLMSKGMIGGTGDMVVLSASCCIALIPLARFSAGIESGFIIILCGILLPIFDIII